MNLNAHFKKSERVVSQKLIDELFDSGNTHSMVAFPLRVVYMAKQRTDDSEPAQVLISVPKRRLHHAVDRNRAKRLIREAYRLNKQLLNSQDRQFIIAFLWISDTLAPTPVVASRVRKILKHIAQASETSQISNTSKT